MRYIRSPAPPNGQATNRSAVSPGRPRYPRASWTPARYSSPGHAGRHRPQPAVEHVAPACCPPGGRSAPAVIAGARWVQAADVDGRPRSGRRGCPGSRPGRWRPRVPGPSGSGLPAAEHPGPGTCRRGSRGRGGTPPARTGTKWTVVTAWPRSCRPGTPGSRWAPGRASTRAAPTAAARTTPRPRRRSHRGRLLQHPVLADSPYSRCIHARWLTIPDVGDDDALGLPGRPRRVDHVRRMSRQQRRGPVRVGQVGIRTAPRTPR